MLPPRQFARQAAVPATSPISGRMSILCKHRNLTAAGPGNAMNRKLVQFGAIVWCMVVSGCTVCENAMRTMKHEPAAFSWKHDRPRSTEVYEQWAERVWGEESANCPELAAERDYYLGFRDGFVDYIWAGGNGEPPPVPPRYLWNVMLRELALALSPILRLQTINFRSKKSKVRFVECEHPQTLRPLLPTR